MPLNPKRDTTHATFRTFTRRSLLIGGAKLGVGGFVASAIAREPLRSVVGPDAHAPVFEAFDAGELFDRVVATLHNKFFDPDQMSRGQWIERANAVRGGVVAAATPAEVIRGINVLLAELRASHLQLLSPDELGYYFLLDLSPRSPGAQQLIASRFWGNRPHFAGIGAFTAEIDGRHFIDGILEGSPAGRAGLANGDEIVDVDGAPYHQIRAFRGKTGTIASLGIRRSAGGTIERVAIPVMALVPRHAFEQATMESARIITHGGKRIGYFRLWAQMDQRPILQAMARLSPGGMLPWSTRDRDERLSSSTISSDLGALTPDPLDSMIVDMRGRIGGTDHSTLLLNLLDGNGQRGAPFFYRGRPRGEGKPPARAQAVNGSFRGRAAMLINHHTRSAGEMVAFSFKQERFGPLLGATTRGHVLASQIEVMPGGLVLQMPVARPEAGGVILEGKGVAPDISVEHVLPYSGGADPVLAAALEQLARRQGD